MARVRPWEVAMVRAWKWLGLGQEMAKVSARKWLRFGPGQWLGLESGNDQGWAREMARVKFRAVARGRDSSCS